jgi:hypothetical protein
VGNGISTATSVGRSCVANSASYWRRSFPRSHSARGIAIVDENTAVWLVPGVGLVTVAGEGVRFARLEGVGPVATVVATGVYVGLGLRRALKVGLFALNARCPTARPKPGSSGIEQQRSDPTFRGKRSELVSSIRSGAVGRGPSGATSAVDRAGRGSTPQ